MSKNNSRATIDETTKFLFDAPGPAIIDLITRLFPIDLNRDSEIVRLSSECISHPGFSRSLPDIVFRVRDSNGADSFIHIEVQTEHDGMMDLRMVKYGYLIGASRSRFDHDECRVIEIPHQVVMYLEEHKRIRDELKVRIILPDDTIVHYTVPVFKLYSYSARELGEMNLYLVIPLVLVKYRKRFETLSRQKNLNREEFDAIVQDVLHDVEEIIGISGKCEDKGVMDEQTKDVILSATMELYNQLHQKYIQDNESREKVENMIESVTQKISRKWHQIGIEEGIERGIEQGMERGMEQGIERGIEQGKIEEARNIARNLIMLGMEDEFIKKATGLSGDEIRRLKI